MKRTLAKRPKVASHFVTVESGNWKESLDKDSTAYLERPTFLGHGDMGGLPFRGGFISRTLMHRKDVSYH